jgi:hypothetical protein
MLLLPIIRGEAFEAPILLDDLLNHDMNMSRSFVKNPDKRSRDVLYHLDLLRLCRPLCDPNVYVWHLSSLRVQLIDSGFYLVSRFGGADFAAGVTTASDRPAIEANDLIIFVLLADFFFPIATRFFPVRASFFVGGSTFTFDIGRAVGELPLVLRFFYVRRFAFFYFDGGGRSIF